MAQYDINLREYWRILKKRKSIVILTAILLGIFSTFFAILQAPTPLYTSVCSIKFEKETTLEGLYARTLSWTGGDDIETQISIITGYSVLQEVARETGLIPKDAVTEKTPLKPKVQAIIENLQSKVAVVRESFTNIINIQVTDVNPVFAQRMADKIASTYKRLHAEQQGKRITDALRYIDEELRKMREKLRNTEEEFNLFSQKNQLISIDLQSENLLLRSKEIKDEIRKKDEDRSEIDSLLIRVNSFVKDQSDTDINFYSTKADRQYQSTNDKLVGLLLKKDTLLENYTQQHPEVIAISQKINENARKMVLLLQLQIDNIRKRKIDLEEGLKNINRKTNLLMEKKLEFNRLKREVQSFRDMTALLEKKNQEALIRKAEKPEEVVIVKNASLPTTPINPPKTATTGVMGAIIGTVLGLVFAFIMETFDTSLGAIEDVEETLRAKVLGVIPQVDAKDIIEGLKDRYPEGMDERLITKTVNLVSHFAPKTMMSESFRALRTNIQFREGEERLKTIAVTSTSPQEGKTLVSTNLAISLAQAGLKTLLIGADLRKPMLANIFGLEISPGLTDIVLGSYPWTDTVKTVTDIIMGKITMDEVMITPGMDNLHIITSGAIPPNPAELIESERLMNFIEEAKKEYDIIIFDSTPVLSTADAVILGTKVDGLLIVYRVGAVSRGLLKRSSAQLEQVKCNIIGVILNGMKPDISPDFQDFRYFKYYSYYGGEGQKREGREDKKIFSFFRRGGEGGPLASNALPSGAEKSLKEKQKGRPSRLLIFFLILVALLFLSVGVLWQNGLIDPLELLDTKLPFRGDNLQPSDIKRPLKVTIKKEPIAIPKKSHNAGTPLSEKQPEPYKETPPPQPEVRTKGVPDMEKVVALPMAVSYPYSLKLGSFRTLERAKKAITEYTRDNKGPSPFWVKVHFKDKGVWYRVYLGHFKELEEAQRFGRDHGLMDAEVKRTSYANLIGTYGSPEELDAEIQALIKLGYSPYIIKDQEGESRLFIGAFLTRSGAEEQYNELRSNGVRSEIVRR